MSNAYELVIQPPPFKLSGKRVSPDGKKWSAAVTFDTPRGPATLEVLLSLPEAVRSLAVEIFHKMIDAAAKKEISFQIRNNPTAAAGLFGMRMPNPAKLIAKAAKKMRNAAMKAANKVVSKLPGPVQSAVAPLLRAVATASNPTELAGLVKKAAKIAGGLKIPGTNIPIMALHPAGAAVAFGSKLIGKENTSAILNQAVDMAEQAVSSGALRKIAPKIAAAKATAVAKRVATNAQFAQEVGLPTLNISSDLHDAGRACVAMLRGLYLGNPEMKKRIETIGTKAKSGDAEARIMWRLMQQISDAARNVKVGDAVGDGFGPGYGLTGYQPPKMAAYGLPVSYQC